MSLVEERARAIFDRYSIKEIRIPVLERTQLYSRSSGETSDVVEKQMYTFTDRDEGETVVALRPEGTPGVVRAYVEAGLDRTDPEQRLFYSGPMFRRERPQKGRYRQFYQFGVEVFGRPDAACDAELLIMIDELCRDLKLPFTMEINSIGDQKVPARLSRGARPVGSSALGRTRRRLPQSHRSQSAAPARLQERREGHGVGAQESRLPVRRMPRAFRHRQGASDRGERPVRRQSADGARPRLLHAHRVRGDGERSRRAEHSGRGRAIRRVGRDDGRCGDCRNRFRNRRRSDGARSGSRWRDADDRAGCRDNFDGASGDASCGHRGARFCGRRTSTSRCSRRSAR